MSRGPGGNASLSLTSIGSCYEVERRGVIPIGAISISPSLMSELDYEVHDDETKNLFSSLFLRLSKSGDKTL